MTRTLGLTWQDEVALSAVKAHQEDLRALLAKDAPKFAECVTDKLLTYALGRGLERYDRRTVKEIASRIAKDDYRFSSLVLEIVNSLPFQMARQDRKKT